jgi:acyl-CoA reductase-like NAD-dependent aldehyde dehydrogenase
MASDVMLERGSRAPKLTWFDADKRFIGGRWVAPSSGATLPLEDPSRGIEVGEIARGTVADIDAAVKTPERALHGPWGPLTATERGRLLAKLGELVTARIDELARIAGYGLVAADGGRQMRLAGQGFVNNYGASGGVGKSGPGREKGFEALYGFSTLKTVAAWHG